MYKYKFSTLYSKRLVFREIVRVSVNVEQIPWIHARLEALESIWHRAIWSHRYLSIQCDNSHQSPYLSTKSLSHYWSEILLIWENSISIKGEKEHAKFYFQKLLYNQISMISLWSKDRFFLFLFFERYYVQLTLNNIAEKACTQEWNLLFPIIYRSHSFKANIWFFAQKS